MVVVRGAINRKRRFKKMNFKKDKIEFISKLEKTLSGIKMSVEEFKLLIVKQQLEMTLLDDYQCTIS